MRAAQYADSSSRNYMLPKLPQLPNDVTRMQNQQFASGMQPLADLRKPEAK
jgi:hypothetical protein